MIPPSLAAVKTKIAQLKKQKKTDARLGVLLVHRHCSGRKELRNFRFRAFMWPALPSPVPTDVTLGIQPVAKTYKVGGPAGDRRLVREEHGVARREDQPSRSC